LADGCEYGVTLYWTHFFGPFGEPVARHIARSAPRESPRLDVGRPARPYGVQAPEIAPPARARWGRLRIQRAGSGARARWSPLLLLVVDREGPGPRPLERGRRPPGAGEPRAPARATGGIRSGGESKQSMPLPPARGRVSAGWGATYWRKSPRADFSLKHLLMEPPRVREARHHPPS
jgi:hypothetical protein